MTSRLHHSRFALLNAVLAVAACSSQKPPSLDPADRGVAPVSRSIQLSADNATIWVVNTESDSISEIDANARTLIREIPLATTSPAIDPITQRYDPAVRPRAIALVDSKGKAYVAGQTAGRVLVVAMGSGLLTASIVVPDPVSVVAAPDGSAVYVVSHEAALVSRIDTATDLVTATVPVGEHPWGASLRADGSLLYVTSFLRNSGVTILPTATFGADAGATFVALPDQPPDPGGNKLIPSGQSRGLYAVVPQPETGALWVPHLLLATGTPQPFLDFESTAFATFTLLNPGGATVDGGSIDQRLLFQSASLTGTASGAFTDVVSGPRDVAFTPDGALALVADAQSEDVLILDARARVEVGLVRPTPSALLEGIAVSSSGTEAYLQGRNTHNVTFLSIAEAGLDAGMPSIQVDGPPVECLAGADPMPANYRRGQRLFYSSNSAQFPVTQNFWIACSTCHLEGLTDAVTWKFEQGPRDTPSNAGGPVNTGFLFRQAVRNSVIDYDQTIRVEQGGDYSRTDPSQLDDLQALADFSNFAIPLPQNPLLDLDAGLSASQLHGQQLFESVGCTRCHSGPFFTDSAFGNPGLDLGGVVQLHDMTAFTCNTGRFPDQPSTDIDGGARIACAFDTPTLCGVFASAPYFHDGSAASLSDAVNRMLAVVDAQLDDAGLGDLTAYVGSLGLGSVIPSPDGGFLRACACQPAGAACGFAGGLGCCNSCSDAGLCL